MLLTCDVSGSVVRIYDASMVGRYGKSNLLLTIEPGTSMSPFWLKTTTRYSFDPPAALNCISSGPLILVKIPDLSPGCKVRYPPHGTPFFTRDYRVSNKWLMDTLVVTYYGGPSYWDWWFHYSAASCYASA